jgi:prepilin-type N-terminal cleavage/methylation domain-containing protein
VTLPCRHSRPTTPSDEGFTLIELLVASLLLAVVVAGSVSLTERSGAMSSTSNTRYRQQSLVDADLARVRRLNDRYSCASGACTSSGSTDPDKNGYFPPTVGTAPNITNSTAGNAFETLCSSTNLVNQLVTDIGTPPAALTGSGITYAIDTTNQAQVHRYTITYSNSSTGEVLRKVTLTPTTVAWCP